MLTRFIIALALLSSPAFANLNAIKGDTGIRIANVSAAQMSIKICGRATGHRRTVRESSDSDLSAGKNFIINVNDLCDRTITVYNTYGTTIWNHKIPHGHGGNISITVHGTIFGQWVNQSWWDKNTPFETLWTTCNIGTAAHRECEDSRVRRHWN